MPETIVIPVIGYAVEPSWFALMEAGVLVIIGIFLALELRRWLRR